MEEDANRDEVCYKFINVDNERCHLCFTPALLGSFVKGEGVTDDVDTMC